jgi:hypothetical protein
MFDFRNNKIVLDVLENFCLHRILRICVKSGKISQLGKHYLTEDLSKNSSDVGSKFEPRPTLRLVGALAT